MPEEDYTAVVVDCSAAAAADCFAVAENCSAVVAG